MRKVILRTHEEKADLDLCWSRPDGDFFASGACHVLAAAFLIEYPAAGFRPWRLDPGAGKRGGHIIVVRGDLVFDYAGYASRHAFLGEYFTAMRGVLPDWDARLIPLESDPIGSEFCGQYNHRHPSQFRHDPLPRARTFVARFPSPEPASVEAW